MAQVPDFITHYHLPDRAPFLNLSDLDGESLADVLTGLASASAAGVSMRRFGPRYMQLRRATEELLRARFVERGGRPERRSPHYFVLGESPWFRGLYRSAAEARLALAGLPTEQVSFTYTDSVRAMGLLAEYGIEASPHPTDGRVYRIEELAEIVGRYGLPSQEAAGSYDDHQTRDVHAFVEVQVWSDGPISQHAPAER